MQHYFKFLFTSDKTCSSESEFWCPITACMDCTKGVFCLVVRLCFCAVSSAWDLGFVILVQKKEKKEIQRTQTGFVLNISEHCKCTEMWFPK